MTVCRALSWLRFCDRLLSPVSVIFKHLIIRANERAIVAILAYPSKSRLMARRATRRLRPCDRLSSPSSVILSNLIIKANDKL